MSLESPRIEVLDTALADQIAAGEVVERPASALKELLDNAVDAGATRIDIEIQEGGKGRIRVRDNGSGIHPEDLPLCVLRHATSKIRDAKELLSLQTLGFRGEALASLAAVARVQIKSRRPQDAVGCLLEARPGQAPRQESAGMPVGTQVEVSDLFAQIPARLKFLRAEATESAHCVDAVLCVALLHPEIAFYLRSANRMVLEFPAGDQAARVSQVLLRRAKGPFVAFEDEHEGVKIRGWIAPLNQGVRSRSGMYLAVRGRVIRDRQVSRILKESLAFGLAAQRYPVGLLIIEPPAQEVDVNVHPQKSEVRFSDAPRVYFALRTVLHRVTQARREEFCPNGSGAGADAGQGAVKAQAGLALRRAALLSKIEEASSSAPSGGGSDGGRSYRLSTRASTSNYQDAKRRLRGQADAMRLNFKGVEKQGGAAQRGFGWAQDGTSGSGFSDNGARPARGSEGFAPAGSGGAPLEARSAERLGGGGPNAEGALSGVAPRAEDSGPVASQPEQEELELLTVLPGPVALCRLGDRILAADLKKVRAHLILGRLTQQWERLGVLDAQALLVPMVLPMATEPLALYLSHQDTLKRLGFEVEAFGQRTLRVRSLPAALGVQDQPEEVAAHLDKLRPWLRLLADQADVAPPLEALAQLPQAGGIEGGSELGQNPAPRLARRWLSQLRQARDLEGVPGLELWDAADLLRR